MDPSYTTAQPGALVQTSSGIALDVPPGTTIEPLLYDPATMGTPFYDANGLLVAFQSDGSLAAVAVGSGQIIAPPGSEISIPQPVTNLLTTGIQSLGNQILHMMGGGTTPTATTPTTHPLLGNPMMLILLGVGAYFLFKKK